MIFCVPLIGNVVFSWCYWTSLLPLTPLIVDFYTIASSPLVSKAAPRVDLLNNRKQSVMINGTLSAPAPLHFGVPQGSVLRPSLFTIYSSGPIANIIRNHGLNVHLYADDYFTLIENNFWFLR